MIFLTKDLSPCYDNNVLRQLVIMCSGSFQDGRFEFAAVTEGETVAVSFFAFLHFESLHLMKLRFCRKFSAVALGWRISFAGEYRNTSENFEKILCLRLRAFWVKIGLSDCLLCCSDLSFASLCPVWIASHSEGMKPAVLSRAVGNLARRFPAA